MVNCFYFQESRFFTTKTQLLVQFYHLFSLKFNYLYTGFHSKPLNFQQTNSIYLLFHYYFLIHSVILYSGLFQVAIIPVCVTLGFRLHGLCVIPTIYFSHYLIYLDHVKCSNFLFPIIASFLSSYYRNQSSSHRVITISRFLIFFRYFGFPYIVSQHRLYISLKSLFFELISHFLKLFHQSFFLNLNYFFKMEKNTYKYSFIY